MFALFFTFWLRLYLVRKPLLSNSALTANIGSYSDGRFLVYFVKRRHLPTLPANLVELATFFAITGKSERAEIGGLPKLVSRNNSLIFGKMISLTDGTSPSQNTHELDPIGTLFILLNSLGQGSSSIS